MMELKDRKFYEGVCEGETFDEGSAFCTRLLDTAEIIEEAGYDVLTDNNGNLLAYALYPNYRDVDDIRCFISNVNTSLFTDTEISEMESLLDSLIEDYYDEESDEFSDDMFEGNQRELGRLVDLFDRQCDWESHMKLIEEAESIGINANQIFFEYYKNFNYNADSNYIRADEYRRKHSQN